MIFEDFNAYRAATFAPRVAIIGAGVAGITIAHILDRKGIPAVVFEAGGEEFTDESQDFYRGKTVGDDYFELDATRLRYLGGSSNHWAGWCRVLDAWDFEKRDHVPDSGWPITRADIEPHLDEVHRILDLPAFRPDRPLTDNMRWMNLIKNEPVLFGEKYRSALADSATRFDASGGCSQSIWTRALHCSLEPSESDTHSVISGAVHAISAIIFLTP